MFCGLEITGNHLANLSEVLSPTDTDFDQKERQAWTQFFEAERLDMCQVSPLPPLINLKNCKRCFRALLYAALKGIGENMAIVLRCASLFSP